MWFIILSNAIRPTALVGKERVSLASPAILCDAGSCRYSGQDGQMTVRSANHLPHYICVYSGMSASTLRTC